MDIDILKTIVAVEEVTAKLNEDNWSSN